VAILLQTTDFLLFVVQVSTKLRNSINFELQ
jgi:hypothetical protein